MWVWLKKLECSKDKDGNNVATTIAGFGAIGAALFGGLFNLVLDDDDPPRNQAGAFNNASPWRWVGQGFHQSRFSENQLELDGKWAFSKGDDPQWADPSFDHSEWASIKTGAAWERRGFKHHDGFAWYRRSFKISADVETKGLYLKLGKIDDADETYFNGVKIGATGRMPPEYATGWDAWRIYRIPPELIRLGKRNTLAVRVYDEGGEGGMMTYTQGIFASTLPEPLLDLAGEWALSLVDNPSYQSGNVSAHEGEFAPIIVPGYWDTQGHKNFDGHAWYRRSFDWADSVRSGELTLLLGRIDDQDEVYLNGELIGKTGGEDPDVKYWQKRRSYSFPASLLKESGNLLLVRVYDEAVSGGIYTGPIGIMTAEDANSYWEQRLAKRRVGKTVWDWLLGRS